jgi:hypothetical protein
MVHTASTGLDFQCGVDAINDLLPITLRRAPDARIVTKVLAA